MHNTLMKILWVIIVAVGWSIIGFGESFAQSNGVRLIISWLIASAFVATFQVQILIHQVDPFKWWKATFGGIFLGIVLFVLVSALVFMGGKGTTFIMSLGIGGVIAGAVLGFIQWKFGAFETLPHNWILISSISWGLGAVIGYVFANVILCKLIPLTSTEILIIDECIAGTILGSITGAFLPKRERTYNVESSTIGKFD